MGSTMLPDFLADITVTTAEVPPYLDGATARGVLWQAAKGRFLLEVPKVGRYLAEEGHRIAIDAVPGGEVTRFLRMTPLAALLYQREMLALHAAAAVPPSGGVILLAGDSGVGKSALLVTLLLRGWRFLSDDLAAVFLDTQGGLTVMPAFPEVALWPDVMARLAHATNPPCGQSVSMPEKFIADPQPLRAIFRLSVHKDDIGMDDIKGVKLFQMLSAFSFNSRIADALLDRGFFMRMAAAIAGSVPVRELRRPRGRWCLEEMADLLENTCQ